jgi:cytochrome c
MKTIWKAVVLAVLVSMAGVAGADDRGTADEAVALVKKAIVFYKANGKDKTAAEINGRTGMFELKDLYLFMSPAAGGAVIAHAANPKLVGKTLTDVHDVDGVEFTKRFREIAAKEGKGWVNYKWPNSKTGQIEPKSTYIERVDDIYFACGIYRAK